MPMSGRSCAHASRDNPDLRFAPLILLTHTSESSISISISATTQEEQHCKQLLTHVGYTGHLDLYVKVEKLP